MRIRRHVVVCCVLVFLAGSALSANLTSTPGTFSLTTPNTEVTVGRWVCLNLATKIDIPLKVKWTDFDRVEFSYRTGSGSSPQPIWETIGTFNKKTEEPTSSIKVSVAGTPAPQNLTAIKVILSYSKGNQTLTKEFNTNAKFGCSQV